MKEILRSLITVKVLMKRCKNNFQLYKSTKVEQNVYPKFISLKFRTHLHVNCCLPSLFWKVIQMRTVICNFKEINFIVNF